jgi:hypothetical protein
MSSKEFGIEALNRFIPFSTPPLWGIVIFFARTCQNMTPIHAKVIAIEKRGGPLSSDRSNWFQIPRHIRADLLWLVSGLPSRR